MNFNPENPTPKKEERTFHRVDESPKEPPKPTDTTDPVSKARQEADIAKAKEEATIANTHSEALKAGFETAEDYKKAIEEGNKRITDVLEENANLKQQYEDGIASNAELQKQLKEQLKLASDKIQEQDDINAQAKKDAEDNITRILHKMKGGTVGILEKALYNLTSPIVTRAYLDFHCHDCHKPDCATRTARFEIPALKDCPPNYSFDICPDCDPDQADTRRLPHFVCDICPVEKMMKESAQLIVQALATVGVKCAFDSDNQYIPTSFTNIKQRHLNKDEQLKILMQNYDIKDTNKPDSDK